MKVDPVVVMTLSVVFIFSVVALHSTHLNRHDCEVGTNAIQSLQKSRSVSMRPDLERGTDTLQWILELRTGKGLRIRRRRQVSICHNARDMAEHGCHSRLSTNHTKGFSYKWRSGLQKLSIEFCRPYGIWPSDTFNHTLPDYLQEYCQILRESLGHCCQGTLWATELLATSYPISSSHPTIASVAK